MLRASSWRIVFGSQPDRKIRIRLKRWKHANFNNCYCCWNIVVVVGNATNFNFPYIHRFSLHKCWSCPVKCYRNILDDERVLCIFYPVSELWSLKCNSHHKASGYLHIFNGFLFSSSKLIPKKYFFHYLVIWKPAYSDSVLHRITRKVFIYYYRMKTDSHTERRAVIHWTVMFSAMFACHASIKFHFIVDFKWNWFYDADNVQNRCSKESPD